MRVIVYGMGAIGGVIAASLVLDGKQVIGIARGGMLDAIRKNGLKLISYRGEETLDVPVVAHPGEIDWRADDIILLTMKSNDTADALAALRACGVYKQIIACTQNGVANEPLALRLFPNVFGVLLMLPAQYTQPGMVVANAMPNFGLLDAGRFPSGLDSQTESLSKSLSTATLTCTSVPNIMDGKYGKLLLNLGNAIAAALGPEARNSKWYDQAREEAEAAYKAAGINHYTVDFNDPRRQLIKRVEHAGIAPAGTSSAQSLVRGTGSIETDYLNGEIALLGRLHGVKTPLNAALTRVADIMVRERMQPGTFPEAELLRLTNECSQ